MIWWWRARALTAVSLALAGSLAAGIMIGSEVLPLPSLVGALFVPVLFAYLLPLVPVVALWYGMDRSVGALDESAARPIAAWDLAVRGGMVLIAVMVTGVTTVEGWWQLGPGYLRNLIGCLGLAQLVAPFVGPRLAGLAPVCAVIISALFGTGPGGLARWWAWPIAETRSGLAFAEAGLLLTAGIAAAVWHHLRP